MPNNNSFADDSTLDDPHPAMSEMAMPEADELDETDLEAVAGGGMGFNHSQNMAF
jgi:hypothetical protein